MSRLGSLLLVFTLMMSVAASRVACAQATGVEHPTDEPGTEQRAMAEALFFAGRSLMEAGRYAEACTKLAESYRLDRASGTLLNLAVCHEKEGKVASAWGEFRQAIPEAQSAARSDREELARTHAAALEQELSFVTFSVPAETLVPGLEIVRNGVAIQAAAWTTELPVDPGEVQVLLRAPGYTPTLQTLKIGRGQHRTMTIGPLLRAPSPVPPAASWTLRRETGLGLLIVGAVSLATGAGAGIRALRLRDTSDEQCPKLDGERRCSQAGATAMSSARKWALAADLTIGAGALSVAVGTYLFATGASERSRTARGALRAGASRWSWDVAAGRRSAYGTLFRSF